MELAPTLLTLGVLFLAGLAADEIGRATRLPRVTMLLLLGLLAGGAGFDLLPGAAHAWFELLSTVALTMVAFLLGGEMTGGFLARRGRAIFTVSLGVVFAAIVIVPLGFVAFGLDPGLALILGAIAMATDPAAISDVIRQSGVENGFTRTLKGIVAVDDAWGLIAFSFVLTIVAQTDGAAGVLLHAGRDLGGAVLLGLLIGLPAAYLTGRISPGEPLQTEAIGIVFLTAGLAIWLEVSFLIAGMTAGAVITNMARHHERAFHEIEHLQWPFMVLFFLLAGATLDVEALLTLGWVGVLYVVLRIASRIAGGWIGARLGRAPEREAPWYGPALLPQAGVAVGMALVAGEAFPGWASQIMALTIATTVAFELLGPPVTLWAIRRVGQ